MSAFLNDLGIALPANPDYYATGAAFGIAVAVFVIAVFTARWLGPHLSALWARYAGARAEGIADRMCALVRSLIAALLLAVAIRVFPWPEVAEFILGLALAAAAAMLVSSFIKGLHLPRWVAFALGAVIFMLILAEVLDGVRSLTEVLDQVGFNAGSRRFSLLTLLQLGVGLLLLVAGVRLVSRIVNHSINRSARLDPTQRLLAQKLVGVVLLIAAFFIGIDMVGIDLTALAVFSGAVGLAVGFGLQKTFGNLIAGIILLMDRSIKPGDTIAVGDSFGSVSKIGVRAVSIVTREGKEHLIPNELLMTEEVVNWSYSSRNVRMGIKVGVAYDCDIALAQRLMIEAATAADRVLKNPSPKVWLREFGESSVDHEIRLWIQDPEDGVASVKSEVLNRLWVLFKENGIEIPFAQRDIRIKEWPAAPSEREA